jgi:hypothetical protein
MAKKKNCRRMKRQEFDIHEEPVAKKRKKETGVLNLDDERVAFKAERVILDQFSPPRYPPMVGEDGKLLLKDELRQFKYMQQGCENAWDWIRSAGESLGFVTDKIPTNLDILQVTNVTLNELAARKENGTDERTRAQVIMEETEEKIKEGVQQIHCFLTRVVDRDGELLVAYFAQSPTVAPKKVSVHLGRVLVD